MPSPPANEAPAPLNTDDGRQALRDLLEELVPDDVDQLDAGLSSTIRDLATWADTNGLLTSFDASYLAELDASAAFDSFATAPLVGWPRTARSTDRLWRIADGFETVQALQAARTASSVTVARAVRMLRWFQRRIDTLTEQQLGELRRVPIVPTSSRLRAAAETVRPGGFRDILAATGVLDLAPSVRLDRLLEPLGIEPLTFADQLRVHVPAAVTAGRVTNDRVVELIRECGRHSDVLDDSAIKATLRDLPWVPCRDVWACRTTARSRLHARLSHKGAAVRGV